MTAKVKQIGGDKSELHSSIILNSCIIVPSPKNVYPSSIGKMEGANPLSGGEQAARGNVPAFLFVPK